MYGMAIGIKGAEAAIAGAAWVGEAVDSGGDSGLSMGAATGVPLACGAKLLLDGRIKQTGVLTPEAGHIDPTEFLREVFRQFENAGRLRSGALEDNVRISRTW
jgi:saccharopine dehydrogenase-like NADP-dependent oxidoreductase